MKIVSFSFYFVILILFYSEVHSQTVTTPSGNPNPTSTQTLCAYKFISDPGTQFDAWVFETNPVNCSVFNLSGLPYYYGVYDSIMYLKWHNVEANANSIIFKAQYYRSNNKHWTEVPVGPFTLNMPAPTFSFGASHNISNGTDPVTISLNPYINTVNNGYDQGLTITSHFEWTLPSGWHTSSNETGTFVSGASIVVIPPSSICTESISVRAYANGQRSEPSTLQVTRYSPIEGLSLVCSSGATFTLNNLPSGSTYEWTAGPNLTIASGQNTSSCTFSSTANGYSHVSVVASTGCGDITPPQKEVWAGIPIINLTGNNHPNALTNEIYEATTEDLPSTTFQWWVVPSWGTIPCTVNSYGKTASVSFPEDGDYTVYVTATNNCGESTSSLFVGVGIYEPYIIYPNPGNDNITLQMSSQGISDSKAKICSTYKVQIWSEKGGLMKTINSNQRRQDISTRLLPNGKYFIHVLKDGKVWKQQVIIQH